MPQIPKECYTIESSPSGTHAIVWPHFDLLKGQKQEEGFDCNWATSFYNPSTTHSICVPNITRFNIHCGLSSHGQVLKLVSFLRHFTQLTDFGMLADFLALLFSSKSVCVIRLLVWSRKPGFLLQSCSQHARKPVETEKK